MPYADEFATLCIVLAGYDMSVTLSVILERHGQGAQTEALPFGPRNHSNFRYLIQLLPDLSEAVRTQTQMSGAKVEQLQLGDVVDAMLAFDYARAGDTDVWWYAMEKPPPRPERGALREWLRTPAAGDPAQLKQFLERLYKVTLP